MPQYIVYQGTETPFVGSLQELYETTCLGYYIFTGGKKTKAVAEVAALVGMPSDKLQLIAFLYANDKQKRIALSKGDVLKIYGIDSQDALDVFPSPPDMPLDAGWLLPDDA